MVVVEWSCCSKLQSVALSSGHMGTACSWHCPHHGLGRRWNTARSTLTTSSTPLQLPPSPCAPLPLDSTATGRKGSAPRTRRCASALCGQRAGGGTTAGFSVVGAAGTAREAVARRQTRRAFPGVRRSVWGTYAGGQRLRLIGAAARGDLMMNDQATCMPPIPLVTPSSDGHDDAVW